MSVKVTNTKDSSLSAADLCRTNGWGVGTELEGDEGYGMSRIRITAIGERAILARAMRRPPQGPPSWGSEAVWVLYCREWSEVTA